MQDPRGITPLTKLLLPHINLVENAMLISYHDPSNKVRMRTT